MRRRTFDKMVREYVGTETTCQPEGRVHPEMVALHKRQAVAAHKSVCAANEAWKQKTRDYDKRQAELKIKGKEVYEVLVESLSQESTQSLVDRVIAMMVCDYHEAGGDENDEALAVYHQSIEESH